MGWNSKTYQTIIAQRKFRACEELAKFLFFLENPAVAKGDSKEYHQEPEEQVASGYYSTELLK